MKWIISVCVMGLLLNAGLAQEKKEVPKDTFAELCKKLHETNLNYPRSLKDITIREFVSHIEETHKITIFLSPKPFSYGAGVFSNTQEQQPSLLDHKISLDTDFKDVSLAKAVATVFSEVNGRMIVHKSSIEIVPLSNYYAMIANNTIAKATKTDDNSGEVQWLSAFNTYVDELCPLTAMVFENVPAKEALETLAETYNASVSFAPDVREQIQEKISQRLMNVALPTAMEALALQLNLQVTQRGNLYFISKTGAIK